MENISSFQLAVWAVVLFISIAVLVFLFKDRLISNHNLLKGSIGKGILGFTFPLLISGFFQQFYTTVDAMMLGQFIGSHAVGAVGPTGMIFFLVLSGMIGFTAGGGIIIAHYFGAKNYTDVKKSIETLYIAILLGSLVITVVGYVMTPYALRAINMPQDLIADAEDYLRVLFLSTVFVFGYNGISSILRSTGDSVTPLLFLIASTAVNIVLDYLFIYTLGWGVAGAAWATFIAQGFSFVVSLVFMGFNRNNYLKLHIHRLLFNKPIFLKMLKMGLPASIQQTIISFSLVLLSRLINNYGSSYTSAYSAIQRLDSFIVLPGMNFMLAVSTFVSQNSGAKQFDRLQKGVNITLLLGVVFSSIVSLLIALKPYLFLSFFLRDGGDIYIGVEYFKISIWFYPVATAMFIFSGAIRGSGKAFTSMGFSIFISLILRIPLAMILDSRLGVHGVWWSFVVTWIAGFTINAMYWYIWGSRKNLI